MKKWSVLLLFLLLLLVTACSNDDDFTGKDFKVSYRPILQDDLDNPEKYHPIMNLDFSGDNIVTDNIYGTGTYELNSDSLVIYFDNEYESLEIKLTELKKSELDFSSYSAIINDIQFQKTDSDKVSHLSNLYVKLNKEMVVEFIK